MTTLQDLRDAYEKVLAPYSPVNSSGQANDAFEVYVLALVLRAAKEEGAQVHFESTDGSSHPNPLVFRTSPGRIYSTAKNYSHAIIEFVDDGLSFEGHVGGYLQAYRSPHFTSIFASVGRNSDPKNVRCGTGRLIEA